MTAVAPVGTGPVVLSLWIPRPPDNANWRGSSRQMNREKRKYWGELNTRLATRYHIPPAPLVPIPRARIHATYYHENRRYFLDPDNALRRLKPVVDWLVGNGFLAGDRADQLEWVIPEQTLKVNAFPHLGPPLCAVRVTLTPIGEGRA